MRNEDLARALSLSEDKTTAIREEEPCDRNTSEIVIFLSGLFSDLSYLRSFEDLNLGYEELERLHDEKQRIIQTAEALGVELDMRVPNPARRGTTMLEILNGDWSPATAETESGEKPNPFSDSEIFRFEDDGGDVLDALLVDGNKVQITTDAHPGNFPQPDLSPKECRALAKWLVEAAARIEAKQ